MKTALLSVHSDPNYGSMLQAYALSAAFDKLGCENEYICYEPFRKQNVIIAFIKRIVKGTLTLLRIKKTVKTEYSYWDTKEFRKQKDLFNQFHRLHIPTSKKKYYCNTIAESNKVYKRFVIGSDQTWSPLLSANPHSISFLPFVSDNSKKCAYAPSIGTTHMSDEYLSSLKDKLSTFAYLSCREYANAKLLTSYTGKHVEYVLDPTLLLKKDEWMKISEPIKMPEKFVLCYILGTKKCIYEFATKLANKHKIPLYIVVTRPEYLTYENALKDVSVRQFLSLINQASHVVTDSYHGTLFSINLGTNFYAFTKRSQLEGMNDNDRIGDFLKVIGIPCRLKNDDDIRLEEDIDFESIHNILSDYRHLSYNYIKRMINE